MNRTGFVAILSREAAPLPARLSKFSVRLHALHGFERLLEAPHLVVLGAPGAAHLVVDRPAGIVWGHLFNRASGERVTQSKAHVLDGTDTREMLARFWGGYVSIRAADGQIEVLREPSGAVACYHFEFEGRHIVTSQPHLLFDHGLISPDIDWTVVAQALAYRDLRPAQTALRGISELLPGAALHIEPDLCLPRTAWSPWTFAGREAGILEPEVAVATLGEALRSTLAAWSGCFERALVEISGGLDSAIVAAGLQTGKGALHCVTFGPEGSDASELPWARAVAEHLDVPLTERIPASGAVDLTRSDARDLPRPCARAFAQAMDRPLQALAQETRADGFLGGGGGDSMFCFLHSARPVIDRFFDEGLGSGLLRTAADMAKLARTDIWSVLTGTLRQALRQPSNMPRPQANPFVPASLLAELPWPAGHPWIEAEPGVLPGKQRHVWSILAMQNHMEGYGREAIAPHISPLMSQPIFETCLRIPSWHWCMGGNNRAVAREAFRDLLPAAIIDRTTKLSFNALVLRIVTANRGIVRDMLLGGSLARERLIDTELVARYLETRLDKGDTLPELMALVDVEAWIRGWQSRSPRAV